MIELFLVGIGTGNPDHLTLQAIKALNAVDLILIPRKGGDKTDLADLRRRICAEVIHDPAIRFAEFDMPARSAAPENYRRTVDDWHRAIAEVWARTIATYPGANRIALLVWGDPSLYDSTLRIARRLNPVPRLRVIPGITSLQALTAAHAIPLNEIGDPFIVTTGRKLRDDGWPAGVDTVVVMLDGECSFRHLEPDGILIWWAAYVGMPEEIILAGPLSEISPMIAEARAEARARHGWIMDIYLLRRQKGAGRS